MEYVCQHEGCSNGAALPDEYEAAQAVAEVMECTAVNAPDGIQFFCKAHRNHALHRMRKLGLLDEPKPPEPPKLAPEAQITEAPLPRVEGAATPLPQVAASELIVVCQKGKLLGVFDGADQADGIRDMAKSLSSEEVFAIKMELNKPGSYPMAIEIKKEAKDGVQKGSKKKRSVQQG
jgi:hypothetical protein